jgi:hypothetical protein
LSGANVLMRFDDRVRQDLAALGCSDLLLAVSLLIYLL